MAAPIHLNFHCFTLGSKKSEGPGKEKHLALEFWLVSRQNYEAFTHNQGFVELL